MLHGQGPDRDPEAPFMLIRRQPQGLYCEVGDFFIDPRGKVERAVITHAHSDHGRPGHGSYLCSETCKNLLKIRIGGDALIESLPFGEKIKIGDYRYEVFYLPKLFFFKIYFFIFYYFFVS